MRSSRGAISLLVVLLIAVAGAFSYVKGPAIVAAVKGDNRKVEKLQVKQDEVKEQIADKHLEIVRDAHGDVAAVNAILNSDAPADRKVSEAKPFAQKADDKLTIVDGGLTFQERKYFQDLVARLLSENAEVRAQAKAELDIRDKHSAELNTQLVALKNKFDEIEKALRKATDNLQAAEARERAANERTQFWIRTVIVMGASFFFFQFILPALAKVFPALAPFDAIWQKLHDAVRVSHKS